MNIPKVSTEKEARNVCRRLWGDFVTRVVSTPQSFGVGILENGRENVRVVMRHHQPPLPVTLQPGTLGRAADSAETLPPRLPESLKEFVKLCLRSGDEEVRKACSRVLKRFRKEQRQRDLDHARSFEKRFTGRDRARAVDGPDEITRLNNYAKAAHRGGKGR